MAADGGRYVLDLDGIDAAFKRGGHLLVLCNPCNPVGRVYGSGRARRRRRGGRGQRRPRLRRRDPRAAALPRRHGTSPTPSLSEATAAHTVTGTAASKGWNLPGLKCAQLLLSNDADAALWAERGFTFEHGTSTPGALGRRRRLPRRRPVAADVVALPRRQPPLLAELLAEHLPEVGYRPPEGTYLAWLDCRRCAAAAARGHRAAEKPGGLLPRAGAGHADRRRGLRRGGPRPRQAELRDPAPDPRGDRPPHGRRGGRPLTFRVVARGFPAMRAGRRSRLRTVSAYMSFMSCLLSYGLCWPEWGVPGQRRIYRYGRGFVHAKDAQLRAVCANLNNVRFSDDAGRACCHDSVEPQAPLLGELRTLSASTGPSRRSPWPGARDSRQAASRPDAATSGPAGRRRSRAAGSSRAGQPDAQAACRPVRRQASPSGAGRVRCQPYATAPVRAGQRTPASAGRRGGVAVLRRPRSRPRLRRRPRSRRRRARRGAGRAAPSRARPSPRTAAGRRVAGHLRPVRAAPARPGRAAARLARRARSRRGRPGTAAAALPGRPRGHPDAPRQPRPAHPRRPQRGGAGRVHHVAARRHPDGGLGDRAVHPGHGRARHRPRRARLRRRRRRLADVGAARQRHQVLAGHGDRERAPARRRRRDVPRRGHRDRHRARTRSPR